jgi:uncharacterized membrane protein YdjX (TVP38/TMEM64 family)
VKLSMANLRPRTAVALIAVSTRGQVIGGVVMLLGIAASAFLTALVTSALFETVLRRQRADEDAIMLRRLESMERQLTAIAERLQAHRD